MANKNLVASMIGKLMPRMDARNHEGAPAYAFTPRHQLAQLAATGTLNQTFYADARAQFDDVYLLASDLEPAFIARTAVFARERGYMKDMPALLLALLSTLPAAEFAPAFRRVVDNGKMLRTFVQIMRSGVVDRKSLGTRPKRLVQGWLETASDIEIMRAAVGQDPSLADVIKMVHPRPADAGRAALYGYLIGRPYDVAALPDIARAFEAFKADPSAPLPDVPFQMLTALPLTATHWAAIGRQAGWHMLRMNLNTFARHGAFEVKGFAEHVASQLCDRKAMARAKAFPYQLMAAHAMIGAGVPRIVRTALEHAMEVAIGNVPTVPGNVVVCPDVSGSMSSPVTGYRKGATTAVRCIDVAALIAAAMLRANPRARVLPFEQDVVAIDLDRHNTVLANAAKLAAIGGGGTNCSAPIERLVKQRADVDLVVMVSDNESWVDANPYRTRGTGLLQAWTKLKVFNPKARLVCLDIQPNATTQAPERPDILNIGGFSDAVFDVIGAFADGTLGADHWVGEIERIEL